MAVTVFASACAGEATDTADPKEPTTTKVATTTIAATTTVAPTTSAATTTVTPTTSAATTTAVPAGLTVSCALDREQLRISCRASGYQEGSHLGWTSTASWASGGGSQWDFTIHDELVAPTAEVFLEECQGTTCQTVVTTLDTSALVPEGGVAPSTTAVPTTPAAPTTTSTAAIETTTDTSTVALAARTSVPGRGSAELLDVADGLAAWLAQDTVLYAISVSDPSAPWIMGAVDAPEHASAAFQDDEYLYAGGSAGLNILRAADPFGEPVGTLTSRIWPSTIVVEGDYAYLTRSDDLLVFDLSDPSEPTEAARMKLTGRHPVNTQVQAGYAYIPATLGGLNVVDVTDPRNPSQVAIIPFESHTVAFKIRGSYGYMARVVSVTPTERWYEGSSILEVLDLSVPHSPTTVGSVTIPTMIEDLDLVGDFAYVTGAQITGPDMLTVIDISSPFNPATVEFPKPDFGQNNFHDIYIHDGYAYVLDSGRGMRVLDVGDPLTPKLVATLEMPQTMYCMHGAGEVIYLCAQERYLNVADVSNPDAPVLTASVGIEPGVHSYSSIVLKDQKVFFNGTGLEVYDLSDPETPEKMPVSISGVDTIAIQGDLLYSTVGEWGLDIWDIGNLSEPLFVSRTNFPIGMPHDMSHDGQWVVGIANKPYSVTVIDVSDPVNPVATDSYVLNDYADSVTVKDDHVYIPRGSDGLDILAIDPSGSLSLIANYPTSYSYNHVAVSGDRAYVLGGIDVFDITDPGEPVLIGQVGSNGIPNRARVHEGYLYLADGYAGLTVVPIEPSD